MNPDKLLRKSFIASLGINAVAICWLGATNLLQATHATTRPPQPPPPSRLIQLEMLDKPKPDVAKGHMPDSTSDTPDTPPNVKVTRTRKAHGKIQDQLTSNSIIAGQSTKNGPLGQSNGPVLPEKNGSHVKGQLSKTKMAALAAPPKPPTAKPALRKPAARHTANKPNKPHNMTAKHGGKPGDQRVAAHPVGKINRNIHVRRPDGPPKPRTIRLANGVIDLRKLQINVHYSIDGPKNIPWKLKPNKFIGKGRVHEIGKPSGGGTCIPASGGNTFIRTGDLTIINNPNSHITGTKFCIPGTGIIPGGGSNPSMLHVYGQGSMASKSPAGAGQGSQPNKSASSVKAGKGSASSQPGKSASSGKGGSGSGSGSGTTSADKHIADGDTQNIKKSEHGGQGNEEAQGQAKKAKDAAQAAMVKAGNRSGLGGRGQGGDQVALAAGLSYDQTDFTSQQILQTRYENLATGPVRGLQGEATPMNIGSEPGAPTRAAHLPEMASDYGHMTPGVLVPKEMRRPVVSPKAHHGAAAPMGAPHGTNPKPTAFHLVPKTVGSHSFRGNILWSPENPKKPSKGVKNSKSKNPAGRAMKGKGIKEGGGDGSGLLGEYYLGMDFEQLMFKRPDHNIDFLWTGTQVDPRLPTGQAFSVRWVGKIKPRYSENYTFYTFSDDGVRLWVDGRLLIANWTIHGGTEDAGQIALEAGKEYSIKVEYYEKNGLSNEIIKLYWQSPSQIKEYVPESCLVYPKPEEDVDNLLAER